MAELQIIKKKLTDLIPDSRNANQGTLRGLAMLEDSLREDGAGRGILLDRNGRVIAGNKTLEQAVSQGFEEVIIVPTDGRQFVATQRIDVDLDSPQGRRMAIRDNRVAEVDLLWDSEQISALANDGVDLSSLWNENELAILTRATEDFDPSQFWQGMPEFESRDLHPHRTIHVHFDNDQDVEAFAKLLGAKITPKTKYLWYPVRPATLPASDGTGLLYTDEADGQSAKG